MKRIIIIVGAVVLAVALAAGSFYGGMAYQRNQANQVRDSFLRSRGLNGNGGTGGAGGFPGGAGNGAGGGGRGFFGGGTVGQVKSVDGNTLTISTAQNETKVTLSDTTRIEKSVQGALSALQPGMQVMVTGQRDANGNITAVQVLILNNGQPNAATPTP